MKIIHHDYNGLQIGQRKTDGYINATAMCVATGSDASEWLSLDGTFKLVAALATKLGVEPKTGESRNSVTTRVSKTFPSLVIVKRGSPSTGGGTWIHPKLAVHLAQWCDPYFALQVSDWVEEWMTTGQNPIAPPAPATQIGGYIKRVEMLEGNLWALPEDYWCVLYESSNLLLKVQNIMKMPVGEFDLLDGSVGKHWSKYRAEKSWAIHPVQGCKYRFPDGRVVSPNAYHFSELGHYRHWERSVYVPTLMPEYLKKKYSAIVKVGGDRNA